MLYSIPGCPVDNYDKDWIEKALVWFEEKLGKSFIRNKEYFIPFNYKFEHENFNSHQAVQYFINFICDYLELDTNLITFNIQWNEAITNEGLPDDFDVDAVEYHDDDWVSILTENGKYIVEIEENTLNDFDAAFYQLVFQLTYINLIHKKVFTFYNAHMVDFAMVLMGFGVVSANVFVRTWQWNGLGFSAWSIKSIGVINHRMYGYLFALLIKYRDKQDELWLKFLTTDVIAFTEDTIKFLEADNPLLQLPISAKDEEVFIKKKFYENKSVFSIEHEVDGKLEGLSTFFHQNGFLWSQRIYKNGVAYTVLSNYNKYDEPVEKGTLFEGNGTLFIYKNDGNLMKIMTYKDGKKISSESFK